MLDIPHIAVLPPEPPSIESPAPSPSVEDAGPLLGLKRPAIPPLPPGAYPTPAYAITEYMHKSKYARYLPEKKRRENCKETLDRHDQMHLRKYGDKILPLLQEARAALDENLVLPAMRVMQFAGEAILENNAVAYNCFRRNTQFITRQGVRSFEDFEDGAQVEVLTHTGAWKPAVVKQYGQQPVHAITITRGTAQHQIWATRNHRWIKQDGSLTDNLQQGDRLRFAPQSFESWAYDETEDPMERLYWCYGFVYGDGTVCKKDGIPTHSMVRLCGAKRQFRERFEEMGFSTTSSASLKGDFMAFTGSYKKTLPVVTDPVPWLRAFVRGWLDADGTHNRSPDGVATFKAIQSSSPEAVDFICRVFPLVGQYVVSATDLSGHETNYGNYKEGTSKMVITSGVGRTSAQFRVAEIGEAETPEPVWCLEVEDDASFVLPFGLATGNCVSSPCNRRRFFAEAVSLLMGGSGVGYSVQKHHVAQLPPLASRDAFTGKMPVYHVVADDKLGWADAIGALMDAYFDGHDVVFDYSQIRARGARMVKTGGKAPGPEPLRRAINLIRTILDQATGRQLRPIECHDIVCMASECVLSGGTRRAALIALFSPSDHEMMEAKTSDHWYRTHPWRARANNSAVLLRQTTTFEDVRRVITHALCWGDPGFYFTDSLEFTINPCGEIQKNPWLYVDSQATLDRLYATPHPAVPEGLKIGDRVAGWGGCNLTTINGNAIRTPEDFYRASRAAALLGTFQAGYTHLPYLGPVSEMIFERDALLGVSISGMVRNPGVLLDPQTLVEGAQTVLRANRELAPVLGINATRRGTCVKPDGNSAVYLGCSASGGHDDHSEEFLRSIEAHNSCPIFQAFAAKNPHMVQPKRLPDGRDSDLDSFVVFAVRPPDGSVFRSQTRAVDFLRRIRMVNQSWIEAGTGAEDPDGRARHNFSNTVYVKEHEREEVTAEIWAHRDVYSGVTLFSDAAEGAHPNTPYRNVNNSAVTPQTQAHLRAQWEKITQGGYNPVDYDAVVEEDDATARQAEAACAGGVCSV